MATEASEQKTVETQAETSKTNPSTENHSSKSGYTYWKRDVNDAHVLPDCTPRKIEGDVAAKIETEPQKTAVGSAWNSAGTWEERNTSVQARKELERILTSSDLVFYESGDDKVICTKATITGDSQAYNIRGRPRLGFEFVVKGRWKGTFGGEVVSGDFHIPEFDSSDLDGFEIKLAPKSGDDASQKAVVAMKNGCRPTIIKSAEILSENVLKAK